MFLWSCVRHNTNENGAHMGLNFLGLGFSFGAKDTGLESALLGIDKQFQQLNATLKSFQTIAAGDATTTAGLGDALDLGGVGDKAKKEVGGLADAMGGMADKAAVGGTGFGRMANKVLGGAGKITGALGWVGLALGPVISGFGEMAESAGGMVDTLAGVPSRIGNTINRLANDGLNLTNSLEAEAVSLGQTARSVGVNMGYVGQDLRRFIGQATGMAMGLNIGADEAARAIRGWDEAAADLGATGISSARDLARFTAALGINADVLRNSTMEMRNLGATDEMIHRITSAITQMGRETGDVAGALNELPQIMQMLERRRALGDTPEQMTAFAADTAAAARGLFQLTQDSDRAREMASQLAGTVTESREAFQNMFAGTEEQLPQLVTELAVTRGQVDESFRLMQAGPGGLIEAMGQLVQATRDAGGTQEQQGQRVGRLMEFMRGRLQQVFGPEMTATLINFWGTMDSETVQAMGQIRNASVDLGDLGRQAHSTGRTLDEVFERMRAGFQTAFRRVARPAVQDFVRDTGRTLRRLRGQMQAAADSGGALGQVMETLSLSAQVGGLALMPASLRSTTIAADELRQMATPLINSFTSWGGILETVGTYVALFVTEVMLAKQEGESWASAIDRVAGRFAETFVGVIADVERFVTQFVDAFARFNWDDLFGPERGEGSAAGAIGRVFRRIGQIDWGRIWSQLQTGFNNLFERVRPWIEQKINQIKGLLGTLISEWWDKINWGNVLRGIGGLVAGLWTVIQPAIMAIGAMIGRWLSDHWVDILMVTDAALTAALAALLVGAIAAVAAIIAAPWVHLWLTLKGVWERWGDDIIAYFQGLGRDLVEIWHFLVAQLEDLWDSVSSFFRDVWDGIAEFFTDLWEGISSFVRGVWQSMGESIQSFVDWLENLWGGFVAWFSNRFPETTQAIIQAIQVWRERFTRIRTFVLDVWDSIREAVSNAVNWISERFSSLVEVMSQIWQAVGNAIFAALQWINESILQPFFNALSSAWEVISESASGVWGWITEIGAAIQTHLVVVVEVLRTAWAGIVSFFTGIFAQINEALAPVARMFERIGEIGVQALDSIMSTAVRLFTGSINTVVGEDMASTEEVMTEAANNVSETMQSVLHDATVQAIVTGFSDGFQQVVENMEEFSQSMVEKFTTLGEGISGILTGLFTTVIDQAIDTMMATELAVEGIIGRLRAITAAQAQLAEARAEAVAGLARPADEEAMRRRMAQLAESPVLQAIHYPDWYSGHGRAGGYRELFSQKMEELRVAIESLQVAPTTGTIEERIRAMRGIQAETRRRGVGGHTGVPGGPGRT